MSFDLDWNYHITLYRDDWPEIQRWCRDNIGEFNQDWYKLGIDPMSFFNDGSVQTTWYFKQEKHAVLFFLKWS